MGELAGRHGLSRSTLLYYDRIGLLRPSGRSAAGFRWYDEDADRRLARICRYRAAGVALEAIRRVLEAPGEDDPSRDGPPGAGAEEVLRGVLLEHLRDLDEELCAVRRRQRLVLEEVGPERGSAFLCGDRFVELLDLAGVTPGQRALLHREFEADDPSGHQAFLEFLLFPAEAVREIRARGGTGSTGASAPER